MEPEKCDDLIWVTYDELPENTVSFVREVILEIQKGSYSSEQVN